jgi:hypothetical protein
MIADNVSPSIFKREPLQVSGLQFEIGGVFHRNTFSLQKYTR